MDRESVDLYMYVLLLDGLSIHLGAHPYGVAGYALVLFRAPFQGSR